MWNLNFDRVMLMNSSCGQLKKFAQLNWKLLPRERRLWQSSGLGTFFLENQIKVYWRKLFTPCLDVGGAASHIGLGTYEKWSTNRNWDELKTRNPARKTSLLCCRRRGWFWPRLQHKCILWPGVLKPPLLRRRQKRRSFCALDLLSPESRGCCCVTLG